MLEEYTTPDLVERWRQAAEAAQRRDFDAVMSVYAADARLGRITFGGGQIRGRGDDP
jgi:ketosteroid isomerase-like protein